MHRFNNPTISDSSDSGTAGMPARFHGNGETPMDRKTFIITGASRGIGSALTRLCLEKGHAVIAVARTVGSLNPLAESNADLEIVQADLSGLPDIEGLAARLRSLVAADPVLVNNAAVQDDWPFGDDRNTVRSIAGEITLNLTAPVLLTHALCRNAHVRHPVVVNVQSLLSLAPKRTASVYSAAKGGLRLFSSALDMAGQAGRVRLLDVYMPLVDTDMTAGRGSGKIAADDAARAIIDAVGGNRRTVHVGKARLVAAIHALHPKLAAALLGRM
jgi:uncharacterized oxidoreductase